jgi:hypothetical protein
VKTYRGSAFINGLFIGLGMGCLLLGWKAWRDYKLLTACRLGIDNLPYPYFIIIGIVLIITGMILEVYYRRKLKK